MQKQTQLTTREEFAQKEDSKPNLSSPLTSSAWWDLTAKADTFKLHDMCRKK